MLAIYCRISVNRPNQKSIKEQELLGIEFAKLNNLDFEIYSDEGLSGSGKSENRPEFERMLNEIGETRKISFFKNKSRQRKGKS